VKRIVTKTENSVLTNTYALVFRIAMSRILKSSAVKPQNVSVVTDHLPPDRGRSGPSSV
jgi:hypothetical protein